MIDFKPLRLHQKAEYDRLLQHAGERGCEYSFTNLFLWGRQMAAFCHDHLVFFSQFNRRSVYLFPVGSPEPKAALDAVIADAASRGIPCRLTGLTQDDCATLQRLYPGRFRYHFDRDGYDYVYAIDDLADLKGRKFQKKRNHLNRFSQDHPDCVSVPLDGENLEAARNMVEQWYKVRIAEDPHGEYMLEQIALDRALRRYDALKMGGLMLVDDGEVLAVTMGSRMSPDTMDIHFEKAREDVDGAYAAVNCEFARYLRMKYPELKYLNREDDMGLEGLRKAKLSYQPHHFEEKYYAYLMEDVHDEECAEAALDGNLRG